MLQKKKVSIINLYDTEGGKVIGVLGICISWFPFLASLPCFYLSRNDTWKINKYRRKVFTVFIDGIY